MEHDGVLANATVAIILQFVSNQHILQLKLTQHYMSVITIIIVIIIMKEKRLACCKQFLPPSHLCYEVWDLRQGPKDSGEAGRYENHRRL